MRQRPPLIVAAFCGLISNAMQQELRVPRRCQWAIEQLYVPQRCNSAAGTSCNAAQRVLSNATLTREMDQEVGRLTHIFDHFIPKSDSPLQLRIADIGAGLGMYHILLHQALKPRHVETFHTILDKSANGVNFSVGEIHAGYHGGHSFPFYSSLECATDIALASGMDAQHWRTVEASREALSGLGDGSLDVLMSLVSWMYHYPEYGYLRASVKLVKPKVGRLVITPKFMERAKAELKGVGFTACQQPKRSPSYLVCCVGCDHPLHL